jgi:D-serine deaminase-like pyridoxal phosphate-dependent protein
VLRGDFLLPIMVLKHAAIRANLELMGTYCKMHGVSLAPHGKTTMAPRLIELQLSAGAWGLTAATAGQARAFRAFGISTILLANELVEPAAVRWAVGELDADDSCRIICLADSLEGVAIMSEAVTATNSQKELEVLVELGFSGGRTGCRSVEEALEVAAAIEAAPGLRLAGVECYEGTIDASTVAATIVRVDALLADVRVLTEALDARQAFSGNTEIIVSAGGSAYFDRVVAHLGEPWDLSLPVRLVLRSGCYITHDSGVYRALSPFDGRAEGSARFAPALEVWGAVLSLPEPDLAIVGFGKRDVPHDFDLPVPERHRHRKTGAVSSTTGLTITALNDQHAYVRGDCHGLEVGDWLGCGISHPCTAFDKWRSIPMVDENYTVVEMIETFF